MLTLHHHLYGRADSRSKFYQNQITLDVYGNTTQAADVSAARQRQNFQGAENLGGSQALRLECIE